MNKELEESIIVLENWLNELNVIFNETHINNTKEREALETTLKELKRLQEENRQYKRIKDITESVKKEEIEEAIKRADKEFIAKDKIREIMIIEKAKLNNCTNNLLANRYKARIEFGQKLLEVK